MICSACRFEVREMQRGLCPKCGAPDMESKADMDRNYRTPHLRAAFVNELRLETLRGPKPVDERPYDPGEYV